MKLFKLIALSLAITSLNSAFAHGEKTHISPKTNVVQTAAVQKDWGIAGQANAVQRTIHINLSDAMRFNPEQLQVEQGQTIRLVLHNTGAQTHELVIGTPDELQAHADLMLKFPNMEHDEPYMAHVSAGKTSELIWMFNRAGTFHFACLIAGHYQVGMKGTVEVRPVSTASAASAQTELTQAEVRKIDVASGKITLKHGEIKNLNMPAMSMVFRLKDPAWLTRFKVGDQVLFSAEQVNGAYTVQSITPVP